VIRIHRAARNRAEAAIIRIAEWRGEIAPARNAGLGRRIR
jgi:hypothetical protein